MIAQRQRVRPGGLQIQNQKATPPGRQACRGMTRTAGQCTRGNTSTPQGHFRQRPPIRVLQSTHRHACPALPPAAALACPVARLLLAFPCFFLVSRAGGEAATASTRGHSHRDAARLHSLLLLLRGERAHRTLRLAVAAPSPLARAFFLPLLLRPACRRFFVSELGGFDLVTLVGNNQKN